jgi:hypothetical protein
LGLTAEALTTVGTATTSAATAATARTGANTCPIEIKIIESTGTYSSNKLFGHIVVEAAGRDSRLRFRGFNSDSYKNS